jgi:hypothetical protein
LDLGVALSGVTETSIRLQKPSLIYPLLHGNTPTWRAKRFHSAMAI